MVAQVVSRAYLTDPAYDVIPITPADSDLTEGPCRGILVTVSGTVNIQMVGLDGTPVDRTGIPLDSGRIYGLQCVKIRAGGTATGIFAIY